MNMEPRLAIVAGGVLHLCWAAFHLAFPRLFSWSRALSGLDPVNRSIMLVMNLCLCFLFLFLGGLSLLHADGLAGGPLGRAVCAGLCGFWLFRLGLQFTHFPALSPRSLALAFFFAATGACYAAPFIFPGP